MFRSRKSLSVTAFLAVGAALTMAAGPASASAAADEPVLVHATQANACKLNARAMPDLGAGDPLTTLTCSNYTTCARAPAEGALCGPPIIGGTYTCVGPQNAQVTDDRWVAVAWRAPETAYVAVACAALRT